MDQVNGDLQSALQELSDAQAAYSRSRLGDLDLHHVGKRRDDAVHAFVGTLRAALEWGAVVVTTAYRDIEVIGIDGDCDETRNSQYAYRLACELHDGSSSVHIDPTKVTAVTLVGRG